jgi:phosphatidylglycerol---prolipoprotein diacylglyceryl transferase
VISLLPSRAIALSIGPVDVHWYGITYAIAFVLGIFLLPRLQKFTRLELTESDRESLFLSVFLGVLLGGRLGFVLLYGGTYFLESPWKIFAVWEGGMASHGGFIGVGLALLFFAMRRHIEFFRLTDTILIPVALGLALGRCGNFMNGELYGTLTTLPWGMHFPGVEGVRHPTQIYAILKDLTIALCSFLSLKHWYRPELERTGLPTALFLTLYATFRFLVEIFRDQPYGYTKIAGLLLSRGQLLTLPLFVFGVTLFVLRSRRVR